MKVALRSKASNNSNITWIEYENNTFPIKESPCPRVAPVQPWRQIFKPPYTNNTTRSNLTLASWSSGRVQDSGLGSRSSPEFNTLPVRLLVVPLSKAFHTALLLSTQEQSGYLWGQICKPWRQVACERLYTPQGVEMDIQMDMECKGPMTREGTCQVCRAELWAWMWTQNSDFTFTFNCATVEVWEWISNFIPHFIIDIITYPRDKQHKSIKPYLSEYNLGPITNMD